MLLCVHMHGVLLISDSLVHMYLLCRTTEEKKDPKKRERHSLSRL